MKNYCTCLFESKIDKNNKCIKCGKYPLGIALSNTLWFLNKQQKKLNNIIK